MKPRTTAAIAALLAAAAIAPSSASAAGGCTSKIVTFDVTGITINERIAATWKYGAGTNDPLQGTATLDTVQTARTAWTGRQRAAATFDELIGHCRVGDRLQGSIHATAPHVETHLQGTWSAGTRSGTCAKDTVAARSLSAEFIRRSLATSPPANTLGVRWSLGAPGQLECAFSAYHRDDGSYSNEHLRDAALDYPQDDYVIAKSQLLARSRLVRLRIHARASAKHGYAGWQYGSTTATLELDGTVTLRRARICTIGPNDPILNNPCLKP